MEDTGTTLIAIDTDYGVALVRAVASGQSGPREIAADRTRPRLSQAITTIRSVAADMVQAVDGLSVSRATIEFGVTFSIHSGQLVAAFVDAGQECTFNVTLEWTPID
jgi:hypothetical protein